MRAATLEEYRKKPDFAQGEHPHDSEGSLYPGFKYEGYAWGMANRRECLHRLQRPRRCLPGGKQYLVVGKTEVTRGRETVISHRPLLQRKPGQSGDLSSALPCMHCENAPCELVCPVGAINSHEGLNDMAVCNRCVGTAIAPTIALTKCAGSIFSRTADFETPSLKPLRNPNVTVRSRGVMEKCTYCVQRINAAKIEAEKENAGRDGKSSPPARPPALRIFLATLTIGTVLLPKRKPTRRTAC